LPKLNWGCDENVYIGETEGRGSGVLRFASEIIEKGLFGNRRTGESFWNLINALQQHRFKAADVVDSDEVSAFRDWAESSKHETE
jgi:hypothetical protein